MSDDLTRGENAKADAAGVVKKGKFAFNRYPSRRIALTFAYLGWNYDGLVRQPHTKNTVEEVIMNALIRLKLIEDWEKCNWNRSGRTDKGVSGYRQIASLTVRSDDPNGEYVFWSDNGAERRDFPITARMNYTKMLNAVLPKNVRILSWAPVPKDFNARFDCNKRSYKYLFPVANFNLATMQTACDYLLGEHDFRNFCKIDNNVKRIEQSYVRMVYSASIDHKNKTRPYDMVELNITASGFLWNQIRCIMSLLFEIGRGNEEPEIIQRLLNIQMMPSKPVYGLADATALCFYNCSYEKNEFNWKWDKMELKKIKNEFLKTYLQLKTQSNLIKNIIDDLNTSFLNELDDGNELSNILISNRSAKQYIPLLKRPRCDALEVKQEKLRIKKQKQNSNLD